MGLAIAVSEPTNGAREFVEMQIPYVVRAKLTGTTDILFHSWNCEAVEEKAKARKGSEKKKTDNVESYVVRNEKGAICLPSEYVRMSIVNAAKFRQDPRSPRKSAQDLYKAALVAMTPLCLFTNVAGELPKVWDYLDRRKVQVQRVGITRVRPAFRLGYTAQLDLMCNLPEYITPGDIHDVLTLAGSVIGLGDFRPTYGRFRIDNFEIV